MPDSSPATWKAERDADGIVWLTIDKPGTSANVLSSGVLKELDALLTQLASERPRGVVLISAKKSGFVAGADIKEFTALTDEASGYQLIHAGQEVMNHLAALPCPTVAAIHGFALGGGLELALACRYRVAVGDERLSLGLPEVMLGIHPGFGGTVRSVRIAGVRPAMQMMLSGKPLRAAGRFARRLRRPAGAGGRAARCRARHGAERARAAARTAHRAPAQQRCAAPVGARLADRARSPNVRRASTTPPPTP